MILLDANYLIAAPQPGSAEFAELARWQRSGDTLSTAAVAWTEFLSGPIHPDDEADVRALLGAGIFVFDETCAATAARLFNATGRKRSLRVDAMIAATAIENDARLATRNRDDFQLFVPYGLKLAN
ncbi:MAG: PIN domain-containing protein [Opitutae bacterium]